MLLKKSLCVLALVILSMFSFSGLLKASSKNIKASSIVQLDSKHSIALWHLLTKTQVTEAELISIFCQQPFLDEFDKRRKIKNAKLEYSKAFADVTSAKTFIANVIESIGPYNFDTQSFPLALYQGDKNYLKLIERMEQNPECVLYGSPMRVFARPLLGEVWLRDGTGTTKMFYAPIPRGLRPLPVFREGLQHNRLEQVEDGLKFWYTIPEEMRNLRVNEEIAERIQPRINEYNYDCARPRDAKGNGMVVTLFLRAISADDKRHSDWDGPVWNPIWNIFFEVTRFIVRVPAVASGLKDKTTVEPAKKEVIIKDWSIGRDKTRIVIAKTQEVTEPVSELKELGIGESQPSAKESQDEATIIGNSEADSGLKNKMGNESADKSPQKELYPRVDSWDEAVEYCKRAGGRLPKVNELRDIYKAECEDQHINEVCAGWYWTSKESGADNQYARVLEFSHYEKYPSIVEKNKASARVRCVY